MRGRKLTVDVYIFDHRFHQFQIRISDNNVATFNNIYQTQVMKSLMAK